MATHEKYYGGCVVNLAEQVTQQNFGDLVGITQQAVSDLVRRGVLVEGAPVGTWLTAYCAHLREIAAGRSGTGDLNLVQERARLAKEQADERELRNAVLRGEYAPLVALEMAAADAGRQIGQILEGIPVQLKRRCPHLTGADLELIQEAIVEARNVAAAITVEADDAVTVDSESIEPGPAGTGIATADAAERVG